MRVVELLNVLQRFPGDEEVDVSDLAIGDLQIVDAGELVAVVRKGTKGHGAQRLPSGEMVRGVDAPEREPAEPDA